MGLIGPVFLELLQRVSDTTYGKCLEQLLVLNKCLANVIASAETQTRVVLTPTLVTLPCTVNTAGQ